MPCSRRSKQLPSCKKTVSNLFAERRRQQEHGRKSKFIVLRNWSENFQMFRISAHDDGFQILWDQADSSLANRLMNELLLEGVQRSQEWEGGVVINRYRNEFETLD